MAFEINNRREFFKRVAGAGGDGNVVDASSYASILAPNDRVKVASSAAAIA